MFEVAVLGEDITQSPNSLEAKIDKAFGNLGIDVNFTRTLLTEPTMKEIRHYPLEELARLFVKEYKRWGKIIADVSRQRSSS